MTKQNHLDINPASDESDRNYDAAPVIRTVHRESTITRMVEHQTAKIPSGAFLIASFGAMAVSLGAEITDRRRVSRFVGMWVGPILTMGVYNKLVKTFGPH